MKLKTIRVRRSRPSAPALALALALTMLCVYLLSLSSMPNHAQNDAASASPASEAELRMEGLTVDFLCDASCGDLTEARIAAANCASSGGAGMLLANGGKFAVVRAAVTPDGANTLPGEGDAPDGTTENNSSASTRLRRSAAGLTLRLSGPANEIAALSDAVNFLRAQAAETGGLADSMEAGGDNARSLTSLLEVYRTQGARTLAALEAVGSDDPTVSLLRDATQAELNRLNDALRAPAPAKLRLLHAAACAQWLDLLDELAEKA